MSTATSRHSVLKLAPSSEVDHLMDSDSELRLGRKKDDNEILLTTLHVLIQLDKPESFVDFLSI